MRDGIHWSCVQRRRCRSIQSSWKCTCVLAREWSWSRRTRSLCGVARTVVSRSTAWTWRVRESADSQGMVDVRVGWQDAPSMSVSDWLRWKSRRNILCFASRRSWPIGGSLMCARGGVDAMTTTGRRGGQGCEVGGRRERLGSIGVVRPAIRQGSVCGETLAAKCVLCVRERVASQRRHRVGRADTRLDHRLNERP